MRRLWPHHDLAQSLGKKLGFSAVLLRRLPRQKTEDAKTMTKTPIEAKHAGATSSPALNVRVPSPVRNLVIILGDQLDGQSSALQDFDPAQDVLWMAEVPEESIHVWSAKQRIAVFLSAMRHYAEVLRVRGLPLFYTRLDDLANLGTLALELGNTICRWCCGTIRISSAPCVNLRRMQRVANSCAWSTGTGNCGFNMEF